MLGEEIINKLRQLLQRDLQTRSFAALHLGGERASLLGVEQRFGRELQLLLEASVGVLIGGLHCFAPLVLQLIVGTAFTIDLVEVKDDSQFWAFWVAFLSLFSGMFLAGHLCGRAIPLMRMKQCAHEAELHQLHSRNAVFAEPISLSQGEQAEYERAETCFAQAYYNQVFCTLLCGCL